MRDCYDGEIARVGHAEIKARAMLAVRQPRLSPGVAYQPDVLRRNTDLVAQQAPQRGTRNGEGAAVTFAEEP